MRSFLLPLITLTDHFVKELRTLARRRVVHPGLHRRPEPRQARGLAQSGSISKAVLRVNMS